MSSNLTMQSSAHGTPVGHLLDHKLGA